MSRKALIRRKAVFDAVTQTVLAKLKLIGEPRISDRAAIGLAAFREGWGEWNDKYRDTVREYWKVTTSQNDFAARLLGSGDLYDLRGRRLVKR